MSSDDIAISVRNLTKTYRIFGHPGDRLKQAMTFGMRRYHREFTAIRDVSFDIRKGETVGIIGRNGSGKSTLLQLICGVLKPTSGLVKVNGRVSALLELGSGFNPEFTGRENAYFQGALIGFTKKEMDERFDDIADFADIGEFIDQPVRTYSSGMFVRLGFAVAVGVDPEVLIVDEALAVGDIRFQSKCYRRLDQLRGGGATVLVVSHAQEQITRMCDSAVLLDRGRTIACGDAIEVTKRYLDSLFDSTLPQRKRPSRNDSDTAFNLDDTRERFHLRPGYSSNEYRWGDRSASILDFRLKVGTIQHNATLNFEDTDLIVEVKVLFHRDVAKPIFGLTVKSKDGNTISGLNSLGHADVSAPRKSGELVLVEFSLSPRLLPGDYFLSLGVVDGSTNEISPMDRRYESIHLHVIGQTSQFGIVNMSSDVRLVDARLSRTQEPERAHP